MSTRQQALEVAKTLHTARTAAAIADFFAGRISDADYAATDAAHGYRHGWYIVAGHSISEEEVTGIPYDTHQGGMAWV